MTVADLMRTEVVVAPPELPVTDVARELRDQDVGSAVVVEDDHPIGMVTDRDIAVRIAADNLDPEQMTARDVMTQDPVTVDADAGVMEVCSAMADAGVRRMPVLKANELAGIVTLDDLTRLLVDELDALTDVVEAESPPY
jgi:CBS domain-containing protein